MYSNLFTQDELASMIETGYVRSNAHPEADLYILNYTEKAAYEGVWNNVTLNCRGLIVDIYGEVFARPFPKFFNYAQAGCPVIDLDEPAVVSDKMDGSLGILYPDFSTGKYAIATRGSFTSDQAIHATEILRTKYADYVPPKGVTMLFEIIYPENRIVCDYGDMDDLVLLGSVQISTGQNWDAADLDWDWPGPKAESFPYQTMREALEAEPRAGKEGFVVHLLDSDVRVKIKQTDYIELHRLVTGLNEKVIWEKLANGESVDDLIANLPDEFHKWAQDVAVRLKEQVNLLTSALVTEYNELVSTFTSEFSRKDFAEKALSRRNKWALFAQLDGKDISSEVWKRCRPEGNQDALRISE